MTELNNEYLIGKRIKDIRKAKNMTQQEVSDKSGIKTTVLSAYENQKKIPGLTTLAILSEVLDVSIDELYFGNKNEDFINRAKDEDEVNVNCFLKLWENKVIRLHEIDVGGTSYCLIVNKYHFEILRLLNTLEEYDYNRDTYSDGDGYIAMVKDSILKSIKRSKNNII